MPEIPDVVQGNPVESAWGNDIRDRTVQRYADAAARDSLTPLPAPGDLAYLDDTGSVQVYDGTAWVTLADVDDLDAYLPLTGGAVSGQLRLTRTGVDAFIIDRGDSPVPEWRIGDNTAGQLYFRAEAVPIMGLYGSGSLRVVVEAGVILDARGGIVGTDAGWSTTSQAPNAAISTSDFRLRRSTAVVATVGDEGDPAARAAVQSRMGGTDPADLLAVIDHLLDRIEALEGP